MYIEGKFQLSTNHHDIIAPYSKIKLGTVYYADDNKLKSALTYAEKEFKHIKNINPSNIQKGLKELHDLLNTHATEMAILISQEAAKPISLAKAEVQRGLAVIKDGITYATIMEKKLPAFLGDDKPNHHAYSKRFPKGILVGITPYNFPLNLVLHKLIPSIASKNVMIIKPAIQTPLTALFLAKLFDQTSLPKALFQVLPCDNTIAQKLIEDKHVHCLSFTGSTTVGKHLQKLIPHKQVLLECGGMATLIVDETANLNNAVTASITGGYNYAGQTCISVQHVYVHQSLYKSFRESFIKQAEQLIYTDPLNENAHLSGLISVEATVKFKAMIDDGTEKGAKKTVLLSPINKALPEVILLEQVPQNAAIMQQEAFGPVVCLHIFRNHNQLITTINNSNFGLQHAIFSQNDAIIELYGNQLDVGTLLINESPSFRSDSMPYGGIKESGNTKESVYSTLLEFSHEKFIIRKN
jgi:glyceraldehyde-3-phosphate dehydrogenase (NADP+)